MKIQIQLLTLILILILGVSCASKPRDIFIPRAVDAKVFSSPDLYYKYYKRYDSALGAFTSEAENLEYKEVEFKELKVNLKVLARKDLNVAVYNDTESLLSLSVPFSTKVSAKCHLNKSKKLSLETRFKESINNLATQYNAEQVMDIPDSRKTKYRNNLKFSEQYILYSDERGTKRIGPVKYVTLDILHENVEEIGCILYGGGYRETVRRLLTDIEDQLMVSLHEEKAQVI